MMSTTSPSPGLAGAIRDTHERLMSGGGRADFRFGGVNAPPAPDVTARRRPGPRPGPPLEAGLGGGHRAVHRRLPHHLSGAPAHQ